MDWVDFMLLIALAIADTVLLVYLRQRRRRQMSQKRMQNVLGLAIRQVNQSDQSRCRAVSGSLAGY